jgi:transcription initiation factor TFIID subunit 12
MLLLADEFVDNVVTAACRVAKMRDAATLDIRDLQIILERTYNIRVPGYASDEIRTIRKFAPTPGYHQKMAAVQAAKVMKGRED